MDNRLKERVDEYVKAHKDEINLTDFYNSAILNHLERLGDFEIRDILEGEDDG
jgi:hypothetical protein